MVRPSAFAIAVAAALAAALAGATAPAAAAEPDGSTVALGYDVSYPQCGRTLPARGDIAVVGVNAGVGTTTNPCLAEQLAWGDAPASAGVPRLADVYVNTANPGHLGDWWPRADMTREGVLVANPAGVCVGASDAACAYVYGYSIAADDALRRGVSRPAERMWWLDVETMNTWGWNRAANLAVLEGMTAYFRGIGARTGVYSTPRQWSQIVGEAGPGSALAGSPSWLAGAVTRAGAEENCRTGALTAGGTVVMSQWVEDGLDHDIACTPGVQGRRPTVTGEARVGGVVAVDVGPWGPDGVTTSVQWLRNDLPIAGATSPVYSPTEADAGTLLSVRVRGARSGAPALTLDSPFVQVAVPGE